MIIDIILDRRDGYGYGSAELDELLEHSEFYEFDDITAAIHARDEEKLKVALVRYIERNGYRDGIADFIWSVDWLV